MEPVEAQLLMLVAAATAVAAAEPAARAVTLRLTVQVHEYLVHRLCQKVAQVETVMVQTEYPVQLILQAAPLQQQAVRAATAAQQVQRAATVLTTEQRTLASPITRERITVQ